MGKTFEDFGDEIMCKFLIYLGDKEKFEECLNNTSLDKNSNEYKDLFSMFEDKIWEELRGRIYEILKEIPYC